MTSEKESGVRAKLNGGGISAVDVTNACHVIIDAASALLANLELLENPATGSTVERQAMAKDARDGIDRLVEVARGLQAVARAA